MKLPGGMIIQWGKSVNIAAVSSLAVNFPIAFPTAAFQGTASFDVDCDCIAQVSALSLTQITIRNDVPGGASGNPAAARWIAIGY